MADMKKFPRRMPPTGILGISATTMFKMALKNYPEKNYKGNSGLVVERTPEENEWIMVCASCFIWKFFAIGFGVFGIIYVFSGGEFLTTGIICLILAWTIYYKKCILAKEQQRNKNNKSR